MKLLRIAVIAALAATLPAQVARVIPPQMRPLMMLQGEWHTADGWIGFRFHEDNLTMKARGREDKPDSAWRDMINIFLKDGQVVADFTDSSGKLIHYSLRNSTGKTLVFIEDGAPARSAHTMTYTREASPDRIRYSLETGDKVTDSGVMTRRALIRPLSE